MALQIFEEKAYSLLRRVDTEEIHIFKGDFTPTGCNYKFVSICGKTNMKEDDSQEISTCLNEDEARKESANFGRNVCGTCVSHLYTTYR